MENEIKLQDAFATVDEMLRQRKEGMRISDCLAISRIVGAFKVKIFRMNDCDWFVGRTLEECKALAIKDFGYDEDSFEDEREITDDEMDALIFSEEDGEPKEKTFRQKLGEVIEDGRYPSMFASTEY